MDGKTITNSRAAQITYRFNIEITTWRLYLIIYNFNWRLWTIIENIELCFHLYHLLFKFLMLAGACRLEIKFDKILRILSWRSNSMFLTQDRVQTIFLDIVKCTCSLVGWLESNDLLIWNFCSNLPVRVLEHSKDY